MSLTLVDITNQIISQFMKKNLVSLDELKDAVKIDKEFEENLLELIRTGLKNLEETGIIAKLHGSDIWILRQPLKSSGQTVDISMETCNEIAEVINSFLDSRGMTKIRADKLNISEPEIVMLINIINEVTFGDNHKDGEF
jgi:hypothetical protein